MLFKYFMTEILRIASITLELENFKSPCAKIILRMIKKEVSNNLCKIYGRNFETFRSALSIYFDFLKLLL